VIVHSDTEFSLFSFISYSDFKFLALGEVDSRENGIIPTAIPTISTLYTSLSPKNLNLGPKKSSTHKQHSETERQRVPKSTQGHPEGPTATRGASHNMNTSTLCDAHHLKRLSEPA
jgi:hypothetical protein